MRAAPSPRPLPPPIRANLVHWSCVQALTLKYHTSKISDFADLSVCMGV